MMLPSTTPAPQSHPQTQPAPSQDITSVDSAINRMIAEAVDHQLLTYAQADQTFTISDARNALLNCPELEHLEPDLLRYRVRDRLKTLERNGLAQRVGVQGANRPLYRLHLESMPSPASTSTAPAPDSPTQSSSQLTQYLEEERTRLRTDMQVILAEADHYGRLLKQFPNEHARISPLLEDAIARGGELKGQLDANIRLRDALVGREDQA